MSEAAWFQTRQGLGSIAQRLQKDRCRIAYVGNSVTAQRGGYVDYLHDGLVNWSGHAHRAIQVGLSGMGSIGCLFTLDQFVLRQKPDFCFIECLVGDSGTKPPAGSIEPVLEGIVRKLISADCLCCFLHAYRGDINSDELLALQKKYENIANYYGIPSIQIGDVIAEGAASGKWSIDELFLDQLHTKPAGAQLMANLTEQAIGIIFSHAETDFTMSLPPPLYSNNLQYAHLSLPTAHMAVMSETFRLGRFRLALNYAELQAGNGLKIEFGTHDIWGLLIVAGPKSGDILIEANDKRRIYPTWDKWCVRELLRSVTFDEPIPRGVEFRLLVTDQGGLELSHPKLLKVSGLMLAGNSRDTCFSQ